MLRSGLGLCLAVMLSLTSVTAAVVRGQMAGATEMVICAGAGVATVTLDAAGKPVAVPHHCPVCTAAAAAVAVAASPGAHRPMAVAQRLAMHLLPGLGSGDVPVRVARGPPVWA